MEQVKVRASSLAELFDCPARWEAKHILHKRLPTSSAALLGTAVHAGTALFDQSELDGNPLTADEAAGAVVDVIQKPAEEVDWSKTSKPEVESLAIPLHKLYCDKIAPTQDYLAVESQCEDLVISDIGLTLTGHVDRVRKTDDGLGVADIKTGTKVAATDYTVNTKGHGIQLGVYELLAASSLGRPMEAPAEIIGLQVAKTDKGRRAATAQILSPREVLLDDDDQPGLLRIAANIIHSGGFYGNPRSQLCNEKYCPVYGQCKWRR